MGSPAFNPNADYSAVPAFDPNGAYGAAQSGSASSPDIFDRIKANWESNTAPQDTGHPIADFVHNAGGRAAQTFVQPILHPIDTAEGILRQTPPGQLLDAVRGNPTAPEQMAQQYAQSAHPIADIAGDVTGGLLQSGVAGAGLTGAGELAAKIPTTAKAGALFQQVASAAKDQPVNLTRTQSALDRVAQLTDAGGPVLNAPNKLLLRSQTVNPISYQEARDFYTNISSLSAQDKIQMNGPMKAAVGELANAFKQDIGDTAASVGQSDQYAQAMRQYAQAKRIQDATKTVAGVAAKAAIPTAGAAILYPALRYLMDLAK